MSIGNPEWADWVVGADKGMPLLKAAYDRGVNTVRLGRPLLCDHKFKWSDCYLARKMVLMRCLAVGYGEYLL